MHDGGESGQRRRGARPVSDARGGASREPERRTRGRHATDTPQKWPDHWFEPRRSATTPRRRRPEETQGRRYAPGTQGTTRSSTDYQRPPAPHPSLAPRTREDRPASGAGAGHAAGLSREQWPAVRAPQEPQHEPRREVQSARRVDQTRVREAVPAVDGTRRTSEYGQGVKQPPLPAQGGKRRKQPANSWTYPLRRAGAVLLALLLLVVALRACGIIGGKEDEEQQVAPAPQTSQTADDVPVSRPIEMTIPKVGLHAKFEKKDCLFKDGAIDPSTLSEACVYTAENRPYSLPGTDASDIVVVAGHAAAGVPAIFDKLYDPSNEHHTVTIGDAMYIRTEQSGDRWLKYEATDLHEPEKTALAQSKEIWGDGPMPGRLLTVTCIQPANPFAPSVKNAVVGWQLQGVVSADEAQLNG